MINCIILDDEVYCVDALTRLVASSDDLHLIGATTRYQDAIKMIQNNRVDLIFLDINMDGLNGLEFARTFGKDCGVVFTTGYSEYTMDSIRLDAIHYLLKPIELPDFLEAIERYKKRHKPAPEIAIAQADGYLFVKTGKSNIMINYTDITYIACGNQYLTFHHNGTKTLSGEYSMKQMEQQLPESLFIRVHRNYIIPIRNIVRVDTNQVLLRDVKDPIPVSESYKDEFNKALGL